MKKRTVEVNDVSQTLVWIPAGEFLMGSPETEVKRRMDEELRVRVLRGGSWIDIGRNVRSANRGAGDPALRFADIGFRLARSEE